VLLAREILREPYWPRWDARALGRKEAVCGPVQYFGLFTFPFGPVPQQQQGEFRKLVFVGASPIRGSISNQDPNDRCMLDVVGFDTTVPAVIADFVRE